MKRCCLLLALLLLLPGCAGGQTPEAEEHTYTSISQEEAREMMEQEDGLIVVDVRRVNEYATGHIPGAVLVPNESITETPPEALPDREQVILVYCRAGHRSKDAAQKLADLGYTNVYEFGGVTTWEGELVAEAAPPIWTAEETPVHVRYDRHWEYADSAESDDAEVINALAEAIQSIEVGEVSDVVTDDFTDLVTFTFPDGSTVQYEFEDQCWVTPDGVRYQAEGLDSVRLILDAMMEGEG